MYLFDYIALVDNFRNAQSFRICAFLLVMKKFLACGDESFNILVSLFS